MNGNAIVDGYEKVALLTGQMLAAAQGSDWDALSGLERRCAEQVALLRAGEPAGALDAAGREIKVRLINRILSDDRAIRELTEPWMASLAELISNSGTRQKLSLAYGISQSG